MSFPETVACLLAGIAAVMAILAALVMRTSKESDRARLRSGRYVASLAIAVLIALCAWCGLYFASRIANVGVVVIAFAAYCYFAFASFALRPKLVGILAGSALISPLVLTVVTLPFTSLALGFVLHDANATYAETSISDGLICRTRPYGMAASDEGQEVELLRPLYGFAYRQVFSRNVSYRLSSQTHAELCAAAATQWQRAAQ